MRYHINFSKREKQALERMAKEQGVNISTLIRYALMIYANASEGMVGEDVINSMGGIPTRIKNLLRI